MYVVYLYPFWRFNSKVSIYYSVLSKWSWKDWFLRKCIFKEFMSIFLHDSLVLCRYKKVSILLKFGHHPLQKSPFEQWYSTANAIAIAEMHSGSLILKACQALSVVHAESPLWCAASSLRRTSHKGSHLVFRADSEIWSFCCWETCMQPDLDKRMHCCRGSSSWLCFTFQMKDNQIRCEDCLHCYVWHTNSDTNVTDL